jgi:hypothetical protein
VTGASKIDAAGDQADIAKTIENCWFSMLFEGWGVDSGGLDGTWLSFWGGGWLKGGWLEGWLVVAGAGWDAGWRWGGHGDRLSRGKPVRGRDLVTLGGQNQHNYQEGIHLSTVD